MLFKKSIQYALILVGILFLLTACGSQAEPDAKQVYSKYYIENYEIDNSKISSRMYLADVTHDGADEMIVVSQGYITKGEERTLGAGSVNVLCQDRGRAILPTVFSNRVSGDLYVSL